MMAGCPGLYDSHRSAVAHRHYYDSPSDETRHELDAARRLDGRDILVYESIIAVVLAAAIYGFIRAGKRVESHVA